MASAPVTIVPILISMTSLDLNPWLSNFVQLNTNKISAFLMIIYGTTLKSDADKNQGDGCNIMFTCEFVAMSACARGSKLCTHLYLLIWHFVQISLTEKVFNYDNIIITPKFQFKYISLMNI